MAKYFTKVERPPLEFFPHSKSWQEDDHVSFFLSRSTMRVLHFLSSFLWNLAPRSTKIAKMWGGYLLYHHITPSPSCMGQVAITTLCSLLARAMSEENAGSATYVGMQIAAIRRSHLTRYKVFDSQWPQQQGPPEHNERVYVLFHCTILYMYRDLTMDWHTALPKNIPDVVLYHTIL